MSMAVANVFMMKRMEREKDRRNSRFHSRSGPYLQGAPPEGHGRAEGNIRHTCFFRPRRQEDPY
jgi:hypothetical protein